MLSLVILLQELLLFVDMEAIVPCLTGKNESVSGSFRKCWRKAQIVWSPSVRDLEGVCLLSDVDGAGDGVEDGGEEVLEGAQVVTDCAKLEYKCL